MLWAWVPRKQTLCWGPVSEGFWGLAAATTQRSPRPTSAAALLTPAVRNGILGQKKNGFFFFCINENKIQEKLPPLPSE